MWQQNYAPLQGSLGLSALVAAFPIFVLLYLLGVRRKPSWVAGLSGLGATIVVALFVETGKFETIKHSLRSLTGDRRLQALLIGFAFGAFMEGAAGFGTPVAVASAMLAGLGFSPFYAAAICLLANTAPVAFGSIAIPVVTLAGVTGLPLDRLSAGVGRICAPMSLFIPGYIVLVASVLTASQIVSPR